MLFRSPIACLAREMSADLRSQADAARAQAKTAGHRIDAPLAA